MNLQRKSAKSVKMPAWLAGVAGLCLLSACGLSEPYVHLKSDFDREDPDFGKDVVVRNEVIVCYSKYATSPATVAALGRQTCAKMGRESRFARTDYTECPMMTPTAAVFSCSPAAADRSAGASPSGAAGATGVPGQPGGPLNGFSEGERPMGTLFGRPGQ